LRTGLGLAVSASLCEFKKAPVWTDFQPTIYSKIVAEGAARNILSGRHGQARRSLWKYAV